MYIQFTFVNQLAKIRIKARGIKYEKHSKKRKELVFCYVMGR